MSRFLLPCDCGAKLPISISQAGTSAPCPGCSKTLEIPTTRQIRLLEQEAGKPVPASSAASGGAGLRIVAALLLLVGLATLSIGGYLAYERRISGIDFKVTEELEIQLGYEAVLKQPPSDTWDYWKYLSEQGLGKEMPAPYFQVKRYLDDREPWMYRMFATSGISLAAFAALCVLIRKPKQS